ncbi:hypothetical protein MPTA5024_19930 [Microbispora sp. ATCC PTA-5024]|nr:hypothetical protein MPTA5024_19930 [Microbispora sp. ATCC PTA-5024]
MLSGGLIQGDSLQQVREHSENGKVTDRSVTFTDNPDNPSEGNQSTTAVQYHGDGGATIQTVTRDASGSTYVKTTRVDKEGNPLDSPLADDDPGPRPAQPNPLATGDDEIQITPEFQARASAYTAPEVMAKQGTERNPGWLASGGIRQLATPETHDEVVAHALEGLYPDQ